MRSIVFDARNTAPEKHHTNDEVAAEFDGANEIAFLYVHLNISQSFQIREKKNENKLMEFMFRCRVIQGVIRIIFIRIFNFFALMVGRNRASETIYRTLAQKL